jgi:hypothetical protein
MIEKILTTIETNKSKRPANHTLNLDGQLLQSVRGSEETFTENASILIVQQFPAN